MTPIQQIQTILGVKADNIFGQKSRAALEALISAGGKVFTGSVELHSVQASSFADPADVAAFKRCKERGKSDQECFRIGDNGIGAGGMNTATEDVCICALPREDWQEKWGTFAKADGKKVAVTYKGERIIGVLGDTMPSRKNLANKAEIDLNPGFQKAFGLKAPFIVPVTWEWAE